MTLTPKKEKFESQFKIVEGGITAPSGFRASAIGCGIKNPNHKRLDLAIIHSDFPTHSEALFTTNKVKAACVRVSAQNIKYNDVRTIIANSGNANACTGVIGIQDAKAMCKSTADSLKIKARQVLVCSTGIIGMPMPIDRIIPNIPSLCNNLTAQGNADAANAIMTSDTRQKSFSIQVAQPDGSFYSIGGIAKGAGMINPNMATMLAFITTDANVAKDEVKFATRYAVEHSFNRITIDGDTSTNDTVIVMSNGASNINLIKKGSEQALLFRAALCKVMQELARMIVADGERVTKFVEIRIRNARTNSDAVKIAKAVANSLLVKCSWHGGDPNWGRVIHAVGYSGAKIREELIDIYFGGLIACRGGLSADTPVAELEKIVKEPKFTVTIDLNLNSAHHEIYTSDLSQAYVDFNASEYSAAVHAKSQKGLK